MCAAAVVQSVISGSTFIEAGLTPADEFRFGSGGPVSFGGGAVIGFQGGTGHGNGDDVNMGTGPSHDDFRFGSGGPVSLGGGSAIGFQGGTGRGTGADVKPIGASVSPDDFRFGSGRAASGFQSKHIGFAGNGGPGSEQLGTAVSIVTPKVENVSGSVVSTDIKEPLDQVATAEEAKVAAPA
jgi:hypothetical protein